MLVQHPYIDAMAMFRRDALLELGGYDTTLSQIGWFGWEDYDMWLRFRSMIYQSRFCRIRSVFIAITKPRC